MFILARFGGKITNRLVEAVIVVHGGIGSQFTRRTALIDLNDQILYVIWICTVVK